MTHTDISDIHVSKHLTYRQMHDELDAAEHYLLQRKELRHRISLDDSWHLHFPNVPGVYALFDQDILVYVGQTGDLRGRMRDLRDTRNHTLRRSLGCHKFSTHSAFVRATASTKFSDPVEIELDAYMATSISVCAKMVRWGRLEIEEHLIAKHKPLYCAKGRRGG